MLQFLLCAIIPVLPGLTFIRLKKNRETFTLTDCYVTGLLFCLLLGEIASCVAVKLDGDFLLYCRLLGGTILGFGLLSLLLNRKFAGLLVRRALGLFARKKEKKKRRKRQIVEIVILAVLLLMQFAEYFLYMPDTAGDTMMETVLTLRQTGSMFAHDPLTGKLLANGMYPLYKLASLPLLYGGIDRFCKLDAGLLLYHLIPFWMILLNFAVMRAWSGILLGDQKEKRNLFMIFVSMLLLMGDGEQASYAYGLLHNGWRGSTVMGVILLAGAYIVYETATEKEWCYGAAAMLPVLGGLLCTQPLLFPPAQMWIPGNDKQWGMLLISILGLYLVRERTRKRWKRREVVLFGVCLIAGMFPGAPFAILGIACALTCMWGIADEWRRGVVMFAGLMVMICMTGTVIPFQAEIPKKWHDSGENREIQDKILLLAEIYEGEVVVVAPEPVMEQLRLSDGRMVLPYGKDLWQPLCNREIRNLYPYGEEELILYEQMKTDYEHPDTIAALAVDMRCNILVLRERISEDAMRQYGWKETEDIPGYAVYCR